jgi:MFS family permease
MDGLEILMSYSSFFLGITEAGIAPAFSLITSMWYKRDEQPLRLAIWYSSTGIGTLVGTLCLYAIGHIHGSLTAWQYQFMIIGAISSIWGCVVFAFLPDNPVSAKFLSQDLRIIAIERMRDELIGIENKTIKLYQIKETLVDPKTWFLVVTILALTLTNGALGAFGTVITTGFGYSTFESILLLGIAGVIIFISVLVSGFVYQNYNRCFKNRLTS